MFLQKFVEVPQEQCYGKIVDVQVVMLRQVPTFLTMQKTVEVSQVQFFDGVVDVPVVVQRQVPTTQGTETCGFSAGAVLLLASFSFFSTFSCADSFSPVSSLPKCSLARLS